MKTKTPGIVVVAVVVLLTALICFGGWRLLDTYIDPIIAQEGSRVSYQDEARAATMDQSIVYMGADTCGQCHEDTADQWLHSSHSGVTCENCHGPGGGHQENGELIPSSATVELCLNCHTQLASRPKDFPQISITEHSFGLPCLDCHNPMHPDVDGAPLMGHATTATMECMKCHGDQGFRPVPVDHSHRPIESCSLCHNQEQN